MDLEPPEAPDGEAVRLVRDALRHLNDFVAVQKHPLTAMLTDPAGGPVAAGRQLRQLLLDAIAALDRPTSGDVKTRQRHRLLVLRYVEGMGVDDVAARLSISRREYNRQHRDALGAVTSVLQENGALQLPGPPESEGGRRQQGQAHGHVPLPLTGFVGRQREMAEIHELLKSARCVTLLGAPGVGKTRLALEIHRQLAARSEAWLSLFPDGGLFVPLSSTRDPELVPPAISLAFGIREAPNRSAVRSLVEHIGERRLLVTLDNFEQVTAAAPAVNELLSACANLRVLVTSREVLRLAAEHHYLVPSLDVPHGATESAEAVGRSDAARLYVDRARAVHHDFRLTEENATAIAEICRRLDGLPLAIELAAARVRLFPPDAFVGRLSGALTLLTGGARDVPERQQTLRSAIDWSYRLLSAEQQELFARLAVFVGGWTLDAAETVCSVAGAGDVVEGLSGLLDKSLVRQEASTGPPRFTMLETIREYAQEQFEASTGDAAAVRRRHAQFYLDLALRADANMLGHDHAAWLGRLRTDLDNLRAAMRWSRDNGELEYALRLVGALQWFWFDGGRWSEGGDWLDSLLALSSPADRSAGRAAALAAAGGYKRGMNDFPAARALLEESVAIWRELGEVRNTGRALVELSVVANAQGDIALARSLTEEGLALARAAGDGPYIGLALYGLGTFALRERDEEAAVRWIDESGAVWLDAGSTGLVALATNSLGDLARAKGRWAEAASHYQASLASVTEATTRQLQAVYLHNLGHVTLRQGDEAEARALFLDALDRYRDLGDIRGMAECVAGLAGVIAVTDPTRGVELLGAALAAIERVGSHPNPSNEPDYDHLLAWARERLGDEPVADALARGRTFTLEHAIGLARR